MSVWINKYKPKNIKEMIINDKKIKIIDNWFKTFTEDKTPNILLLYGPSGVGKTTLAQLLLKKYNYEILEYNSSNLRGPKSIDKMFDRVFNNKSVIEFFFDKKTGLLMDEIESLCNGGDRGGMNEFLKMMNLQIKSGVKNRIPIICTYSQYTDKRIKDLRKISLEIKLTKICDYELNKLMEKILKNEKMNLDILAKKAVIEHSSGDIRRLINILYDLYMRYCIGNKTVEIDKEMIEKFMLNYGDKNVERQIYEATTQIMNNKMELDDMLNIYNEDSLLFPMMIHENYQRVIDNRKISNEEKFDMIVNMGELLNQTDILQTELYQNSNFDLGSSAGTILTLGSNKISELPKYKCVKDTIEYTRYLNRISLYSTNRKFLISLISKLNTHLSNTEIYYLSEYIVQFLFNKKNQTNQDLIKIVYKLREHNMNVDDVDTLLKINKFYNPIVKKKYTNKLKKELSQIYQNIINSQ